MKESEFTFAQVLHDNNKTGTGRAKYIQDGEFVTVEFAFADNSMLERSGPHEVQWANVHINDQVEPDSIIVFDPSEVSGDKVARWANESQAKHTFMVANSAIYRLYDGSGKVIWQGNINNNGDRFNNIGRLPEALEVDMYLMVLNYEADPELGHATRLPRDEEKRVWKRIKKGHDITRYA